MFWSPMSREFMDCDKFLPLMGPRKWRELSLPSDYHFPVYLLTLYTLCDILTVQNIIESEKYSIEKNRMIIVPFYCNEAIKRNQHI